jgi:hypothetical protein
MEVHIRAGERAEPHLRSGRRQPSLEEFILMPRANGVLPVTALEHHCRLDTPGCKNGLAALVQVASVPNDEARQKGLDVSFQIAHPTVVAPGANAAHLHVVVGPLPRPQFTGNSVSVVDRAGCPAEVAYPTRPDVLTCQRAFAAEDASTGLRRRDGWSIAPQLGGGDPRRAFAHREGDGARHEAKTEG